MKKSDKHPAEPQAVIVTEQQMQQMGITDPQQVLDIANKVAHYVRTNNLSSNFSGKEYVQVEGWQFAGSLFGLVAKIVDFKNESDYIVPVEFTWKVWDKSKQAYINKSHTAKGMYKYFAEAQCVTADGRVVGQGFAMCTNEEVKKHTFDEYAILSMAQTRAVGKAYRMALSFIIKAAGYQPTPAEEMADVEEAEQQATVVELPDETRKKINSFKSADELRTWGNQQRQYKNNPVFLDLVHKKLKALEKAK